MGRCFVPGDIPTVETVAYQGDIDRIMQAVTAGHNADWVVVSLHQQGAGRNREEPPDQTVAVGGAVTAADAGVFVAHCAGRIGGIERCTPPRVVVYGPGSFMVQPDQVEHVPSRMMSRFGWGDDDTGDLLERRAGNEGRVGTGAGTNTEVPTIGGAITVVELERRRPAAVTLYPVTLNGVGEGRHLSGLRLIPPPGEQHAAGVAVLDGRFRPFGLGVDQDARFSGSAA
jgi:hypothetical protein